MKRNISLIATYVSLAFLCIGLINIVSAKPPPEAFAACENVAVGGSCTMNTPEGSLNGICMIPPREKQNRTLCVPENHRKNGRQKKQTTNEQ